MGRALPILFNTEMVRAILDGRKTVTRRAIKPKYREDEGGFQVCTNKATGERWVEKYDWDERSFDSPRYVNPPYQPGDILYVRETFCPNYFDESIAGCRGDGLRGNRSAYKADYNKAVVGDVVPEPKWTPSIHMPKEAARIWLRCTDVRVEQLQEITDGGILKEGLDGVVFEDEEEGLSIIAKSRFVRLWNSTIKKSDLARYGWDASPWVWVIEFERCEKPVSV